MLLQVADALSRAATHFKAKYGRPVVLVVDGVDHVAAEDEEVGKIKGDSQRVSFSKKRHDQHKPRCSTLCSSWARHGQPSSL